MTGTLDSIFPEDTRTENQITRDVFKVITYESKCVKCGVSVNETPLLGTTPKGEAPAQWMCENCKKLTTKKQKPFMPLSELREYYLFDCSMKAIEDHYMYKLPKKQAEEMNKPTLTGWIKYWRKALKSDILIVFHPKRKNHGIHENLLELPSESSTLA